MTYGTIVCVGSLGMFLESNWTKVHQAAGNMKLPMAAQIAGALTNIVLDPIFISVLGQGTAGAAIATSLGNIMASAYYLWYFLKKSRVLSISFKDFTCGNGKRRTAPFGLQLRLRRREAVPLGGALYQKELPGGRNPGHSALLCPP